LRTCRGRAQHKRDARDQRPLQSAAAVHSPHLLLASSMAAQIGLFRGVVPA
jgi:hypothetical protein